MPVREWNTCSEQPGTSLSVHPSHWSSNTTCITGLNDEKACDPDICCVITQAFDPHTIVSSISHADWKHPVPEKSALAPPRDVNSHYSRSEVLSVKFPNSHRSPIPSQMHDTKYSCYAFMLFLSQQYINMYCEPLRIRCILIKYVLVMCLGPKVTQVDTKLN